MSSDPISGTLRLRSLAQLASPSDIKGTKAAAGREPAASAHTGAGVALLDKIADSMALIETGVRALQAAEDNPDMTIRDVGPEISTLRQGVNQLYFVYDEVDAELRKQCTSSGR